MYRVLALLLLMLAAGAAEASALRCGNKLVREGDTEGKVRALCGDPTEVHERLVTRPVIRRHPAPPPRVIHWHGGPVGLRAHHDDGHHHRREVTRSVVLWTYNFGPNRLMHRLRFEDGVLVGMKTLGRGYRETER